MRRLPLRGTLLNAGAVLLGATVGLAFAQHLPSHLLSTALAGLGLVTCVMGIRMALATPSILVAAAAVALGGLLGSAFGLEAGLDRAAEGVRQALGGGGRFNEALLTTSLLFCVGPMTILGCVQDGVERRIDILALKSLLDGIAAMVFAATLGPGVLVTAGVVLLVQGTLTLLARPLAPLARNERLMEDVSATGGILLLAIGLGLAEVRKFPVADFLPALVLAPLFVMWGGWRSRQRVLSESKP